MKISITKYTDVNELRKCASQTIDRESKLTLDEAYGLMHSPIRSQIFRVDCENIPTFVATHVVRHVTIVPFVKSNREDSIAYSGQDRGRYEPVNMSFIANAEALINIAAKRLCNKAHKETIDLVYQIKKEMQLVDYDLAFRLVPSCIKDRTCREGKRSCGLLKKFLTNNPELCTIENMLDRESWYREWNKK